MARPCLSEVLSYLGVGIEEQMHCELSSLIKSWNQAKSEPGSGTLRETASLLKADECNEDIDFAQNQVGGFLWGPN